MFGSKTGFGIAALSIALLSCASTPLPAGIACETRSFAVVDDFPGARRGPCRALSGSSVRITIAPEDTGVTNPSPWYAFKLVPFETATATIEIDYRDEAHRYHPKISDDGSNWRRLDTGNIAVEDGESTARLEVPLDGDPVWVAAQEVLVGDDYENWFDALSTRPGVELREIGRSLEGRRLVSISHDTHADRVVLLVGRQHPPEVTGALAMHVFLDTVFADTPLARKFRERFRVIAVPLLNPDGVARGHWRHNAGGVDLNRDWGPFTQPETSAVAQLLDEMDARGDTPVLFLDYHSTTRNLFYTQMPDDVSRLPGFAAAWLARARAALGDYPFTHEPRPVSGAANGKQYMYRRYGVPSMTYEVGDETARDSIASSARVFAEALMRELLARE